MRYPRPTNSKDGVMRLTINVQYRICLEDLKIALGDIINSDFNLPDKADPFKDPNIGETVLEKISKKDIIKRCKDLFWQRGENMWTYSEGWYPHRNSIEGFSSAHINEYFPELVKK